MTLSHSAPLRLTTMLAVLPIWFSGPFSFAGEAPARLENIALGKPYRFTPSLSKKSPEALKVLTDGLYAADPLYTQEGTVFLHLQNPKQITFDLKEIAPIAGISVSTAAGDATSGKDFNVWPGRIDIYTSDDNSIYYHVGELTSLHDAENGSLPPFGEYVRRKIKTTRLSTKGRYVKLVFSYGRGAVIDEIEIYKGDNVLLAAPPQGREFSNDAEISKAFELVAIDPARVQPEAETANLEKTRELQAFVFKRRYLQDIDALLTQAASLKKADRARLVEKLEALRSRAEANVPQGDAYGILPHGAFGEEILKQQAAIWQAQGHKGLVLWQNDAEGYLPWMEAPPAGAANVMPQLSARLMQGEYRSISFNITNASGSAKVLEINLRGLPGGDNPDYVAFHPVAWTETPWRLAVAAALPPGRKGESGYQIRVPAGMTQVVSLTIKGPASAGVFDGKIDLQEVAESGAWAASLPFVLNVSSMKYPETQSMGLGGFELASNDSLRRRYGVFREVLPAFVKVLREHRVNHPWTTRTEFAFGRFDSNHDYATPGDQPETTHFLNWTKNLLPGSSRYHVALTVGTKDHKAVIMGCDHALDPEGFQKRINRWLGFWREVVTKAGLRPEQVYLKIIDEPGFNSAAPYIEDKVISTWAEAIQKSGTGFKVFLNPIHDAPWGVDPQLYKDVDVICVKYSHMLREDKRYIPFYQSKGKELSIYECYGAPAHLYDPYSYFRLQAWMGWKLGAKSMFFWNFSETSTGKGFMDSWNNGLNHWYYTPFFLAPDSVTTSIQAEAMRDGIQDYEYLQMLKRALQDAAEAKSMPVFEKAQALLENAAERVLGGEVLEEPRWSWPKKLDRREADKVRLEILDCLEELNNNR